MLKKYRLDNKYIRAQWERTEDQKTAAEMVVRLKEFKNLPVYYIGVEMFGSVFQGLHDVEIDRKIADYGYALTCESLEKYLEATYGKDNPGEFIVGATLMSMDYEKYYKNGCFIDLDGNDTGTDFYNLDNSDELEGKAEFPGNWV